MYKKLFILIILLQINIYQTHRHLKQANVIEKGQSQSNVKNNEPIFTCDYEQFNQEAQQIRDQIKQTQQDENKSHGRVLQTTFAYNAATADYIRIKLDVTNFNNFTTTDATKTAKWAAAKSTFLKILQSTVAFYERRLKVNRKIDLIQFGNQWCYNSYVGIPSVDMSNGISGYDIVIYVGVVDDTSPTGGYAGRGGYCHQDINGRPITGMFVYNINSIDLDNYDTKGNYDDNIDLTMHEMGHIFFMNSGLFNDFRYSNGSTIPTNQVYEQIGTDSSAYYVIKTPNVLQVARDHYNCQTLQGARLEQVYNNQGVLQVGSHWEKMHIEYEFMNPQIIHGMKYTKFSAALLKDTGWYGVDLDQTELYNYGKDEGCSFALYQCTAPTNQFYEFCDTLGLDQCTKYHEQKSWCNSNSYYANCLYRQAVGHCQDPSEYRSGYSNYLMEQYGPHSKCLQTTLIRNGYSWQGNDYQSGCYQFECQACNQILFKVGTNSANWFTCTQEGEKTISNSEYNGKVYCPKYEDFCQPYANYCYDNLCNKNGICTDGFCECAFGYGGNQCQIICHASCQKCYGTASTECCDSSCLYGCTGPTASDCTTHTATITIPPNCQSNSCLTTEYYNITTTSCQPCNTNCLTCTGSQISNCQSCNTNYYLSDTTCVQNCPSNYFKNETSRRCDQCNANCKECSQQATNCTECNNNNWLQNNLCGTVCTGSTYQNNNTWTCSQCHSTCQTCSNSASTNCVTCPANRQKDASTNECILSCLTNQFYDRTNFICQNCNPLCKTCSGSANTNCLSCDGTVPRFLESGECVTDCSVYSQQYGNTTTYTCEDCTLVNCFSCINGTHCSQCDPGYFRDSQNKGCCSKQNCGECNADGFTCNFCAPGYYFQNDGTANAFNCENTCPSGYYKNDSANPKICSQCDSKCQECTSQTVCSSCKSSYYLKDNSCLTQAECEAFPAYIALNNQCQQCGTNCSSCSGSTTNCNSCQANSWLKVNQCVQSCNTNQYKNNSTWTCANCNETCLTCSGPANTDCDTCSPPRVKNPSNGKCESSCTANQYLDNTDNCQPCDDQCLTCNGGSSSNCDSCKPAQNRFLYQSQCVLDCYQYPQYFPDSTTNECKLCQVGNCSQCSATTICSNCGTYFKNSDSTQCCLVDNCQTCPSSTCNQCKSGYYIQPDGQSCSQTCPDSYYQNNAASPQACSSCSVISNCDFCSSNTVCTKCLTNYYLYNDGCITSAACSALGSSIALAGICQSCQVNCKSCSTSTTFCTECKDNFWLLDNACGTSCNINQFKNNSTWTCQNCNPSCTTCDGPLSTDCSSCTLPRTYNPGTKECVLTCSVTQYYDSTTTNCENCDNLCLTCNGGTSSNCQSCKNTQNRFLEGTQCVLDCYPYSQKYGNTNTQTCESCPIQNCDRCSSASICQTCDSTFSLNFDSTQCCSTANCKICPSAAGTCTECQDTYYLQQDGVTCLSTCDAGYYKNNDANPKICSQCTISNCIECSSNTVCTKCSSTYLRQNNGCILLTDCQAVQGNFINGDMCSQCDLSCKTCSQTSTNCTSCNDNSWLKNNVCGTTCLSNQFKNNITWTCQNCHTSCLTCSNSESNNCITCSGSRTFNPLTNECEATCNLNEFYNSTSTNCQACHTQCATCSGSESNNCESCFSAQNRFLEGSECVTDCYIFSKKYGDTTTQTCEICNIAGCDNCTSASVCNNCNAPYILNTLGTQCCNTNNCQSCPSHVCNLCQSTYYLKADQTCTNTCPTGQFGNDNLNPPACQQCSQSDCDSCTLTSCTKCSNTHYLHNQLCITEAQCNAITGKIALSNVCESCTGNCKTCSGTQSNCVTCNDNFWLLSNNCGTNCNTDQWKNNSTWTCDDCDDTCATCNGPSSSDCLTCGSTRTFDSQTNTCYLNCAANEYYDLALTTCQPCHLNCNTCSGSTDSNCLSCKSSQNRFLEGSQCVTDCSTFSKYGDTQTQTCQTCTLDNCNICTNATHCSQCSGVYILNGDSTECCPVSNCKSCPSLSCDDCIVTVHTCNECIAGHYLRADRTCQTTCETGYYKDDSGSIKVCSTCSSSLSDCTECSSSTQCTQCASNFYLFSNNCIDQATCQSKEGYIPLSGVCEQCQGNCKNCAGTQTNCVDCLDNFWLLSNNCGTSCNTNQFKNNNTWTCDDCDNTCTTCDGSSTSNCLTCTSPRTINPSTKTCELSCSVNEYYDQTLTTCQPCHSDCNTCSGSANTNCLSCKSSPSRFLEGSQCVTDCSTFSKYGDTATQRCETCTLSSCTTCTNSTHCQQCDGALILNEDSTQCCSVSNCKICSSLSCDECIAGHYLRADGTCQTTCETGYYQDDSGSIKVCSLCSSSLSQCTQCSSSIQCTKCASNYYLFSDNCIDQATCQSKEGYIPLSGVCETCQGNCKNCAVTQTSCVDCPDNFWLLVNNCGTSCNTDQFKNNNTWTCDDCHFSCETCNGPESTNCLTCDGVQRIFDGSTNECKSQCPPGQYYNSTDSNCQNCHENCATCTGASDQLCQSCKSSPQRFLEGTECVLDCYPYSQKYGDTDTLTCKPCTITDCQKCDTASQCNTCVGTLTPNQDKTQCCSTSYCQSCPSQTCLTCQNSYFLQPDSITCSSTCPTTHYGNVVTKVCVSCESTCLTCSGPEADDCLSCASPTWLLSTTCVASCGDNYYGDAARVCQSCHSTCLTCSGSQSNQCLTCVAGRIHQANTKTCELNCAINEFYNPTSFLCESCDPSCSTCNGSSNNNCITCASGKFLLANQCVTVCGNNKYGDTQTGECEACHSSCLTCSGNLQTQCLTCDQSRPQKYLKNNECVSSCGQGYYSTNSNQCQQCHESCSSCTNNLPCDNTCQPGYYKDNKDRCQRCNWQCKTCVNNRNNCLSCNAPRALYQNDCLWFCPSKYYKSLSDPENILCSECHSNCGSCDGPLSNNCITCSNYRFIVYNGECIQNCPESTFKGWYKGSIQCVPCHETCKSCYSASQWGCQSCIDGYTKLWGQCVKNDCTAGQYLQLTGNQPKCHDCHNSCKECYGNSKWQCTECYDGYTFRWGECVQNQCNPGQFKYWQFGPCLNCDASCKECNGGGRWSCTECHPGYSLRWGQCVI